MNEAITLAAGLLALGLLSAQGWALAHLLGQNGRLLLRLDALESNLVARAFVPAAPAAPSAFGLPVGAQAPGFSLPGLYGETVTLNALRAGGRPVMLLFSSPGCGPCASFLPEVGRWQREHADRLTIALLSYGTPEANRAKAAEHGLSNVLLLRDGKLANAYGSDGTPDAVVVLPDGTIGSPIALDGVDSVRALLAETVEAAPAVPAPSVALVGRANGKAPDRAVAPQTVSAVAALGAPAPEHMFPD